MRNWRAWPIWLWLVVAGMTVLWLAIGPGIRYRQAEKAIRRFEANPSPSTTQDLVELLARRVPTHRQGKRILELVLRPVVTTRSGYPVGKIPMINLEWPYRLDFSQKHDTYVYLGSFVGLEGHATPLHRMREVNVIGSAPVILPCAIRPLPAGTYEGRIRVNGTVAK